MKLMRSIGVKEIGLIYTNNAVQNYKTRFNIIYS